MRTSVALLAMLAALTLPCVHAQTAPQQPDAARQSGQLSSQQSTDFAQARQLFGQGKFADALTILKDLHDHHPRNAEVAKFAAEAAINTGDYTYAEATLQPIAAADPSDWQARALLARTYAQERKGPERDATLADLKKLHDNTTDQRFRQLTQFMVERVNTANFGKLEIYWSLTPYSVYRIYQFGRVINSEGKRIFLISLESNDSEQPAWAQKHPDLAAAGDRFFSLDGYRDEPRADGQPPTTQTHFTFGFFENGRPSYDTVRQRMLDIAEGRSRPLSSRTGLPIPK